jgi:hypothetical protein
MPHSNLSEVLPHSTVAQNFSRGAYRPHILNV